MVSQRLVASGHGSKPCDAIVDAVIGLESLWKPDPPQPDRNLKGTSMTNECSAHTERMKPVDSIEGDSVDDTSLLKERATAALGFIGSHECGEHVDRQYFAPGVGGVVAIFLFPITP